MNQEILIDIQKEINEYINGNGDYEPVIESIRNYLGNIDVLKNAKGGVIIFFDKKEGKDNEDEPNDLTMQLFPFKLNIPIFEDENLISNESLHKILRKINEKKSYSSFLHFDHFIKNFATKNHLKLKIHSDFVLDYDKYSRDDWDVFADRVNNGEEEKNRYEQVLIGSGSSVVAFIPIPVLSTPSILIAIDIEHILESDHSLEKIYTSIFFRSRDFIAKYLYSRLLMSLRSFIKDKYKKKIKISEPELVLKFCKELCHVLLPISYKVTEKISDDELIEWPEEIYYDKWPEHDQKSEYTLILSEKYTVEFKLTTFSYWKIDNDNSENGLYELIHCNSPMYDSSKQQSIILIQLLFEAVHDTWELMNDIEITVINRLQEKVEEIGDSISREINEKIKEKFLEVKKEAKKNPNYSPRNVFEIDYNPEISTERGRVYLRINNKPLLDWFEFDGDKLSGFIYLKEILRLTQTKKIVEASEIYNIGLTPKNLNNIVADCNPELEPIRSVSKGKKSNSKFDENDDGIQDSHPLHLNVPNKNSISEDDELHVIFNGVSSFLQKYKDHDSIEDMMIDKNTIVKNDFYTALLSWFKVIHEIIKKKKSIKHNPNYNKATYIGQELLKFAVPFRDLDPKMWQEKYELELAELYTYQITKSQSENNYFDIENKNKTKRKQGVLDSLNAFYKKLIEVMSTSPYKEDFTFFIKNLEESNLINTKTNKPFTKETLGYENKGEYHIEWDF